MPPSINIKSTAGIDFRYLLIPNTSESKSDSEIAMGTRKNRYLLLLNVFSEKFTHETVFISPLTPLTSKPTRVGSSIVLRFLRRKSKD